VHGHVISATTAEPLHTLTGGQAVSEAAVHRTDWWLHIGSQIQGAGTWVCDSNGWSHICVPIPLGLQVSA